MRLAMLGATRSRSFVARTVPPSIRPADARLGPVENESLPPIEGPIDGRARQGRRLAKRARLGQGERVLLANVAGGPAGTYKEELVTDSGY